ncbi:MAG: hypothetical protein CME71_03985 [Halobacteriovorax sp.]|nr:hypothetical protein [Halobacteriovorax sp.]
MHSFILSITLLFFSSVYAGEQFTYFSVKQQSNAKSVALPIPIFAPQETPLFDRIAAGFSDYRLRAGDAAARVLAGNTLSAVGGLSGIGFSLVRDFGGFSINANRQLAPDLFDDDRWLIVDELTIMIDASDYLGGLRDDGVIDISETNLAAFAGIAFKRTYRLTHFANSYSEGLTKDYEKLIFPFKWFRPSHFQQLAPYEYLEKEDSLSVRAGGVVSAPIGGGLAVGAGVLASFERSAKLTLQSLGPDDQAGPLERLRISYTSEKSAAVAAQAKLQADFLGILKLTLFAYDFEYSLSSSQTWNLTLDDPSLHRLSEHSDPILEKGINAVVKLRTPNLDDLAPYIVSSETRKQETMKSRYAALIIGGKKEQATEHIQTVKNNVVRSFFKHNFLKQRQVQNILSRLVSELFSNFLKLPTLVNNAAIENKRISLEYEAVKNLIEDKEDLDLIDPSERISLRIMHEATVSTKSSKMRDYFSSYLSYYSGADPAIVRLLDEGHLRPPYQFQTNFQVSQAGILNISKTSVEALHRIFDNICETKPKNKLYRFRSLFNFCKWKLQADLRRYLLEVFHQEIALSSYRDCSKVTKWYMRASKKRALLESCMRSVSRRDENQALSIVPMWRLKDLLNEVVTQSKDRIDLYSLFGLSNVHAYGQVSASKEEGLPIRAMFKEGLWHGLGVVDAAKKENLRREPASVIE